ncbi:MAG: hypothetical protein H6607_12125 [Flavobacteriales bacterium]|nr:hypothetical protein [Flavobacteriales bacterium]
MQVFHKNYDSASYYFYEAFKVHKEFGLHIQYFVNVEIYFAPNPDEKKLKDYIQEYLTYFIDYKTSTFLNAERRAKLPLSVLEYVDSNKDNWRMTFLMNHDVNAARSVRYYDIIDQFLRINVYKHIDSTTRVEILKNPTQDIMTLNTALYTSFDKTSQKYILNYVEEFGYPKERREFGSIAYADFYLLMRHCFSKRSDTAVLNMILTAMIKGVEKGYLSNDYFASCVDYDFGFDPATGYRKHYYGSLPFVGYGLSEKRQYYNLAKVDEMRKKIGLLTLYEEAMLQNELDDLPAEYIAQYGDTNR